MTANNSSNNLPSNKSWELAVGLYPGVLIGMRTYEEEDYNTYVIYLPFINIFLTIDN